MQPGPADAPMIAAPLLALFLAASVPATSVPDDRRSLEELLAEYAATRDARLEALRTEVDSLLRQLELEIDAGGSRRVEDLRKKLIKLGPEVAPLLVRQLDPGANSEVEAIRRRSLELSRVLLELDTLSITDDLIALARRGTNYGQRNALRVLSRTPEPERVSPILRTLFGKENGPPRDATLAAIAAIGGPENDAFVGDSLNPSDPELARVALTALATSRCASAAPQVAHLLVEPSVATRFGDLLVAYYSACPSLVDEAVCDAFMRMIVQEDFKATPSVLYIGFLARHSDEWSRDVKRSMETISLRPDTVGGEALIALALSGDRSARKSLLEPYDDEIDEHPDYARAWASRAHIQFRLENYKAATKDYTKALAAKTQSPTDRRTDWHEALARSYARMGKVREASQWLEKSSLSADRRRELSRDPDFREVAEHSKYGKVFDVGS
jgi:hypothetical protein